MARCVVKFGGSNFKTAGDMKKILRAVQNYETPPIIVVSAFHGITDELITLMNSPDITEKSIHNISDKIKKIKQECLETNIDDGKVRNTAYLDLYERLDSLSRILLGTHYIGEIPPFIRDKILSHGECLSSLIVTAILEHNGIAAMEWLPENIGLITDGEEGNATVDLPVAKSSIASMLPADKVCVIPGFYGIGPTGKTTLLGRGGTDYSAAAIVHCVEATCLDVWKDVDGYLTADPKCVASPKRVTRLGYSEAAELSYFGAHILHPRTVEPLEELGIPIRIFNIDAAHDGLNPLSIIGPDSDAPKGPKSVTYSDDFAVLTLTGAGVGIKPGILARITTALDTYNINIRSVVTSQTAINIYLNEEDLERTDILIQSLNLPSISHIVPKKELSIVAVVGDGLGEAPEVAGKIMEALDEEGIRFRIFSVGASDAAAYAVIPRHQRHAAVRVLHKKYFEK